MFGWDLDGHVERVLVGASNGRSKGTTRVSGSIVRLVHLTILGFFGVSVGFQQGFQGCMIHLQSLLSASLGH